MYSKTASFPGRTSAPSTNTSAFFHPFAPTRCLRPSHISQYILTHGVSAISRCPTQLCDPSLRMPPHPHGWGGQHEKRRGLSHEPKPSSTLLHLPLNTKTLACHQEPQQYSSKRWALVGLWRPNSLGPDSRTPTWLIPAFPDTKMVFPTGTRDNPGLGSLVFPPQISLALFNFCFCGPSSPPAPPRRPVTPLRCTFGVGTAGSGPGPHPSQVCCRA